MNSIHVLVTRFRLLAATLLVSLASLASANTSDEHPAQVLVVDTTERMIAELEAKGEQFKNDPALLRARVDEIITPNLDFASMTKLAVGKHWRAADAGQRKSLVSEFRELLLSTYTKSLTEYSGQGIEFLPFRAEKRDDRARVRSEFRQGDTAVPVTYKLRDKQDEWKIYDIEIDGISLVTNYRTSFSDKISKDGVDGLIGDLVAKNQARTEDSQ